ncbi:hypothetical protein KC973_01735 [Candidatus Saccharibacteria bacterium]|nr:hypothetical protein [Candidatus Saccharibacteria bacterium]
MIKRLFKHIKSNQRGSFMAAVLLITIVITAIGVSLAELVVSQYAHTKRSAFVANALLVAEAGIEQSLKELNSDEAFTGFSSAQTFFNSDQQGKGEYTTTVVDASSGSAKIVTSTGKVYRKSDLATPVSTRTIRVTIVGTESDGYSVHTGPGGLILTGSGNITNSDVFVNGTITLTGASKIGTYNNPVNVQVAHQSCPTGTNPGATYPSVCTSGNPISMAYSTAIYGTVCATNQTDYGPNPSHNILPGVDGEGLQVGCEAPPVSQPTFDRNAHISSMTTAVSGNDKDYDCSKWKNPVGFKRTWPANLRLNGDVRAASSCDLTITGDVYITGDLDIGGAAKITVDESVGTDRPVVLVDGKIDVGGSGQIIANSQGTGIHFISWDSNASCGSSCTSITGTELRQTQDFETIDVGGAANMSGMIFQAYWGKVSIRGSGNVGSAVGQTVDLSGAGTVTFGTKLSSGSKTWTVTSYQQIYQ